MDALLSKHQLLHRLEELEPLTRPAIRVLSRYIGFEDLPVGCSKLGGMPDFPDGVEWPQYKDRPLALLAQFYLPDVAPNDVENALPKTGMIYFFYDMVDQPFLGYDPTVSGAWKVVYSDVTPDLLKRASPPSPIDPEYVMPVCDVSFEPELTFPPYHSDEIALLGFTENEKHLYWELVNRKEVHRLLGYPAEEQDDSRFTVQLASSGIYPGNSVDLEDPKYTLLLSGVYDWRLLFQMADDNDGGAAWFGGAGGRLFYWIRKQDLAERNFDHVCIDFEWQ